MDAYEKYYRRGYNAINDLIEVYGNGYDPEKTEEFRKKLVFKAQNNPRLVKEEQKNIMLTTIIALLGLNKESMERTEKYSEYNKCTFPVNVRGLSLPENEKQRLADFDNQRVKSTDFDDWLSIKIDVPSDSKNVDHLRRVRNGLLHSNFFVEDNNMFLDIAHIKTKSYYESELLVSEFNNFVFEYFSNSEGLGMTEKIFNYDMVISDIISREQLFYALKKTVVYEMDYDHLKTLCSDTPELILKEVTDENWRINIYKFIEKLSKTKNYENFKITPRVLTNEEIAHIAVYLELNYGDKFFELDNATQVGIITTHLNYMLIPKREVSNMLLHFWYLYATLYNGRFNSVYFMGDEFAVDSTFPALMILKAYLVMYRMQHNNFTELDYSKINFDIADAKIKMISDNEKSSITTEDYFQESFIKEKAKGVLTEDTEIWNKVVCEVVRNSLAHGNAVPYVDTKTLESCIELKDIDPKKGSIRIIKMPINKFEEFLNSEAFLPKYCYQLEDVVTKTRKKEES